jgi:hypothetical protein
MITQHECHQSITDILELQKAGRASVRCFDKSKWNIKFSSVWYMGTNISEATATPFAGLNRCNLINTYIYP